MAQIVFIAYPSPIAMGRTRSNFYRMRQPTADLGESTCSRELAAP